MMEIAILTDIHMGARADSSFILDSQEKFYSTVFFPEVDRRGIRHLFLLGDTFENRKSVNILTLHRARKMFFDPLKDRGIKVTAILGNHDVFFRNDNSVNIMRPIADMYPNIDLIEGNAVRTFGSLDVAFISWINRSNFEEAKTFISSLKDVPILCGHFEISGFDMTPGRPCEGGLPAEMFSQFERVLSGHFHTMSDDGRIRYISNNTQTNWSDVDEKKGFHILDTETRKLTHIENPNEVFIRILYDRVTDPTRFDIEGRCRDKIVRVLVNSFLNVSHDALALFVERIAAVAHSVETIELESHIAEDMTTEVEKPEGDLKDVIRSYVDESVESADVDKDRLKGMLLDLLEDAAAVIGDET